MRSHRKPLIGNFPVRGFVVYGGWEIKRLRDWEVGRVKRYSHIQGSQPRLASLVCPFQRKGRE